MVLTATVTASGSAGVNVPAAATAGNTLPALSCYLNQPGSASYLLIGTDLDGPTCGLVRMSSGTYQAIMIDGVSGWNATFVIVY